MGGSDLVVTNNNGDGGGISADYYTFNNPNYPSISANLNTIFFSKGISVSGGLSVSGSSQLNGGLSVSGNVSIMKNSGYDAITWTKSNGVNQSGSNSLVFNILNNSTINTSIGIKNNSYINNSVSSADFTSPASSYDRILYGFNSGNNAIGTQVLFYISNDSGVTWRSLGRTLDNSRSSGNIYSHFNFIIPAGCMVKLNLSGTETYIPGSSTLPDGTSNYFNWQFVVVKFGK